MQLKLDDYELEGVPLGHFIHFVSQQWPLQIMEPSINNAIQSALNVKGGWPIGDGVDRTKVFGEAATEKFGSSLWRWLPGGLQPTDAQSDS